MKTGEGRAVAGYNASAEAKLKQNLKLDVRLVREQKSFLCISASSIARPGTQFVSVELRFVFTLSLIRTHENLPELLRASHNSPGLIKTYKNWLELIRPH